MCVVRVVLILYLTMKLSVYKKTIHYSNLTSYMFRPYETTIIRLHVSEKYNIIFLFLYISET